MTVPGSRRVMPSMAPRTASIDGRLSAARATSMSMSPAGKRRQLIEQAQRVAQPSASDQRQALEARQASTSSPSASATRASWSRVAWYGMRRKSKRWQRETIVAGTLWASVVASTKMRVRRRLFQGLEKRVPGRRRELVRLVDDVDPIATFAGSVRDLVAQVANVVDAAVGGRVDLDQVQRATVQRRQTQRAGVARIAVVGVLAVDGAVQDARDARLARAARAR